MEAPGTFRMEFVVASLKASNEKSDCLARFDPLTRRGVSDTLNCLVGSESKVLQVMMRYSQLCRRA